jgi:hypothetical protein
LQLPFLFVRSFSVNKATRLANQFMLALRAIDFHFGLVGGEVRFAAARVKGFAAMVAGQRLFTETAFEHAQPPFQKKRRDGIPSGCHRGLGVH